MRVMRMMKRLDAQLWRMMNGWGYPIAFIGTLSAVHYGGVWALYVIGGVFIGIALLGLMIEVPARYRERRTTRAFSQARLTKHGRR